MKTCTPILAGDLIDNKAYNDTCAIRMSYGLLMAGVSLPGARLIEILISILRNAPQPNLCTRMRSHPDEL